MPRSPTPTYCFALTVVRDGERYLLVKERKVNEGWSLPAGQVEPGEAIGDAAKREALEEAGVPIELVGVLRVEHTPRMDGTARLRVFFLGRAVDDTPPKSVPDDESLGAAWLGLDEIRGLTLRSDDVREAIEFVHNGGRVLPLDVLTPEGTGWR